MPASTTVNHTCRGHLSSSFSVLLCESKCPLVLPRGQRHVVGPSFSYNNLVKYSSFILCASFTVGYWPGQASKNNSKSITVPAPSVLDRMLNLESWIRPLCQQIQPNLALCYNPVVQYPQDPFHHMSTSIC